MGQLNQNNNNYYTHNKYSSSKFWTTETKHKNQTFHNKKAQLITLKNINKF